MMRTSKRKVFFLVMLLVSLIASLVISVGVIKKHTDYKKLNPPLSRPAAELCDSDNLVAHFKFDELMGSFTPDETGDKDGESVNLFNVKYLSELFYGEQKQVKGVKGGAFEFNGNQWVKAGNRSCYNTQEFTAAIWVLQSDEEIHIPTFMAKSSWPAYDGWWLYTDNRTLGLGLAWGYGYTHLETDFKFPLNEWHHVAITVSNARNEVQFFVNGEPYGEKHENVPAWLINWNRSLIIGGYDGSGNWPWRGHLDDARFYSKILSDEEILEIYLSEEVI